LQQAANEAGARIRARARQEDQEAIDAMKKRGLTVHTPTPEIEAEWQRMAEELWPRVRGTWMPADIFDAARASVAEYRQKNIR
jgi:TRAP-type C4-dicarboxylate transport system substrate-binding protein